MEILKSLRGGICKIDRACPTCGEKYTSVEGCAFSNCYYQIKGKKSSGVWVIRPWQRVDDFLHVFDDSQNLNDYKILKFDCRRLSEPKPDDDDL